MDCDQWVDIMARYVPHDIHFAQFQLEASLYKRWGIYLKSKPFFFLSRSLSFVCPFYQWPIWFAQKSHNGAHNLHPIPNLESTLRDEALLNRRPSFIWRRAIKHATSFYCPATRSYFLKGVTTTTTMRASSKLARLRLSLKSNFVPHYEIEITQQVQK